MPVPDLKSKATFDVAPFRKGVQDMLTDLRAIRDLAKQVGTIKLTTNLSAGKDFQRATSQIRSALAEAVPTDMQRRIDTMFAGFDVGVNSAAQSARVFEAESAALRARINELSNAVRITRAEFQSGFGDATPQEIADLTANMHRLQGELEQVGAEAKKTFGVWSNEALKAEMATRTAVQTVEAANGRISRLGLASQVKLGASEALAQFGPQANVAANGFVQLAKGYETARLSGVFFEKQLTKNNIQLAEGRKTVEQLSGAFNVMPNITEEAFKVLLRNGYSFQQATEAMKLYAGSALAAGKDVGGAWSALADDVQRGSTIMSNLYGITTNQATAQDKYAQSIGTTSKKLTDQQKAEAYLVGLRKESTQELADADDILKGYIGSMGEANLELQRSGQELGKNLLPVVNSGTRLLVGLLDTYNALPAPVKTTTTVLLASAVALGVLATPIASLVTLWRTVTTARAAAAAGAALEATAETALTGAVIRQNVALTVKNFLMQDAGALYMKLNSQAMLYQGSMASNAAATNVFTGAISRATLGLKAFVGAISIYTVAATAALALGLYWADQVKQTTKTYEDMDAANEAAFEKLMARVKELRSQHTELGNAQAKVLLIQQQLLDAQQGPLLGVNSATGERIYGKPDEARIKQLQADLVAARQNVTLLYTEAQRRGVLNLKLTEDQTKAVKELANTLAARKFELKLEGLTDMGRDLAKLDKEFTDLREKFKQPFYVNGKLLDPAQTPALRDGLANLDAQKLAEQAALRKKYATDAAKQARESALSVQAAEIEAMRDGQAKVQAQRLSEIAQIKRETAEKAKALADFPSQQAKIEGDGQKIIAAKRRQWANEDAAQARENAKRVQDAEKAARDARISSMSEGLKKEEAQRAAALADLKASIAEQVKALAGSPAAQAGVQAAGREQVAALIAQQNRERLQALEAVNKQVEEAQQSARAAEIAAIADETQRRSAQRAEELEAVRRDVAAKVKALAGYPAQQQALEEAAQRTIAAKRRQWAAEDEAESKARAQRIALAWQTAQNAQFGSDQAGRGLQSAQLELRLSRQLAVAKENATQVAQIELQAVRERATLAQQTAEAQRQHDAANLKSALDRALSDTKLSADERKALWAGYYADLAKLDSDFQAGAAARLKQQEADARAAQEALRAAYLAESNKPIQASEDRMQQLAWAKELSRSDAETLRLNQQISAERGDQIKQLQGQLLGLGGVVLTTEQRREVESKIKGLQHDQAVALQEQKDVAKALIASTLSRLDAEAQLAEKLAGTATEQEAAQQRQLSAARLRLAELDKQIAKEDREQERNALIEQRYELVGKIYDLEGKIKDTPLDAEKGRLALYKQQAQAQLALRGLGDDKNAQARLTVQIAAAELLLANRRVQAARNELELQAALSDQAAARLALVQALTSQQEATATDGAASPAAQDSIKRFLEEAARRQLELENGLVDAAEARAQAMAQIKGLGEDVVANAQRELEFTRRRLALTEQQLQIENLSSKDRAEVLRQRVLLLGQEAEQELKLLEAERSRRALLEALSDAEEQLNREAAGGGLVRAEQATRRLVEARRGLTRAERDYAEVRRLNEVAPSTGNAEKLKSATQTLTAAIREQRESIRALAGSYRQQISEMEGVQSAAARLREVAYGGQEPFNAQQESMRLQAIRARRDDAQQALREALQAGVPADIQRATTELSKLEERYQKQAALIEKQTGQRLSLTGEAETRRLADQVDALGIIYDQEALNLAARARLADQEAENALSLQTTAQYFNDGLKRFEESMAGRLQQLDEATNQLDTTLANIKGEEDQAASNELARQNSDNQRKKSPTATYTTQALDEAAQRLAAGVVQGATAVSQETKSDTSAILKHVQEFTRTYLQEAQQGPKALALAVPAVAPTTNHTEVYNFGDINVLGTQVFDPRQAARDIRRELENDLRRTGKRCP